MKNLILNIIGLLMTTVYFKFNKFLRAYNILKKERAGIGVIENIIGFSLIVCFISWYKNYMG